MRSVFAGAPLSPSFGLSLLCAAATCGLDDQADPRRSFGARLQGDERLARPTTGGRFEFTFTPKHGSLLNLVDGYFSKLARSILRHIRVASKRELKDRIMAAMDDINQHPVVHT
jgi:hypothetical protein